MDLSSLTNVLLRILNNKIKCELPSDLFIDSVSITDTYLLYRVLYDNFLDPDQLLVTLIDRMYNNTFLSSCAFCLRMNANPNKYIRVPSYGHMHIISYVYVRIPDESLRNKLLYMLLLAGSNPQLYNYKDSPEKISVSQWIKQHYPNKEFDVGNVYVNMQSSDLSDAIKIPAILMNKSDMVNFIQNPITPEDQEIIILARSDKLYNQLKNVKHSISFFNAQSFAEITNNISPNYLISNQILIKMIGNKENEYILQELGTMLSFTVNRGVYMDEEQYKIIKSMGQEIVKQINKSYRIPYWKKVCSNQADDNIDNRLKSLSISLGIELNNKKTICADLDNISKSDPQQAIIASLRRQKTIMLGEISNISELIGTPPNMVCRNRSDFDIDPMGYNNIDISNYRDPTGAIWCFLSDTYQDLLLNRINPYTGQNLPEDFLASVEEKLKRLKDLGIYKTLPINKAIEELNVSDEISNELSNELLQSMFRIIAINKINTVIIENMSIEDLQKILDDAQISVNILPFTKKHVLYTMAWIFNLSNDDELNNILSQMQLI